MTVAPVVVNPDMASKNASLAVSGVSQSMNGSMPNSENITQASDASSRPSCRCSSALRGLMPKVVVAPTASVTAMVAAKASQSCSPLKRHTASGSDMKAVSTRSSCPSTLNTMA